MTAEAPETDEAESDAHPGDSALFIIYDRVQRRKVLFSVLRLGAR